MAQAIASATNQNASAPVELGHLSDVGISEPWQVAFFLPDSFMDLRHVQDDACGFDINRSVAVLGQVVQAPKTVFGDKPGRSELPLRAPDGAATKAKPISREGPPRTSVPLRLADGTVIILTWFGDAREVTSSLTVGHKAIAQGSLHQFQGRWEITDPTVVEERWIGWCRPNYPGAGKRMNAVAVRNRIMSIFRDIRGRAADVCERMFAHYASPAEVLKVIGAPKGATDFARLITLAHCPKDPNTGYAAIEALERFGALMTLKGLVDSHDRESFQRRALPLKVAPRLAQWKVKPSPSQRSALAKLEAVYSADRSARGFLSGDTGTGKTLTYNTLAAAVVDQGGRVAVLVPNESLAGQVQKEFNEIFPDVPTVLVTGDTKATGAEAPVAIGTTALINRPAGSFDLLICDEQQKLGAEQRRKLRSDTCHVLDVTATAIPRTQALAQVGLITTVHLREGHSKKNVATRLWQREEMRELFVSVRKTIEDGARVLVVYPAISTSKSANGLRSIEDAIDKWESNFKGLVRVVNGKLKSGEKAANLKDIVDGTARIGICTSAIEVGINIPNLRQVVVVGPDRFGLTTLHQLRGRLAREGGRGHFDMLLLDKASADTLERLQVLEKVTDGYELAEADLRLRGPGELKANGKRQSGGSLSALYGREVKPEHLLEMEPVLRKWLSRSDTRAEMET